MSDSNLKTIDRLVKGLQTSDGAGVKLTRVLSHNLQRRLDPFLMLDAFRNDHHGKPRRSGRGQMFNQVGSVLEYSA